MPPRPLHHWKTLWLGLLILTFLVWAWQRGRTHEEFIGAHLGKDSWHSLVSSGGHLHWLTETLPPGFKNRNHFAYDSTPHRKAEPWFPPPFTSTHNNRGGVTRSAYGIAHWLIILLFLLSWSTLLLLRSRRIHSLTTPKTPPEPAP